MLSKMKLHAYIKSGKLQKADKNIPCVIGSLIVLANIKGDCML